MAHTTTDESLPNPFSDPASSTPPADVHPPAAQPEMSADVSGINPPSAPAQSTTANDETAPATAPARPLSPPSVPSSAVLPATAAAPVPTSPPPAEPNAPPVDPKIASLAAIFPAFDHELLQDILNQCNGNEEQAVDILLGMSDPDHVPVATTTTNSNSQTELDAQFAERLMLEEQDAAAREYEAYSARGRSQQQQQGNLPYEPRRSSRRRSGEGYPAAPPPEPSLQDHFRDFISPRREGGQGSEQGAGGGGINTAELQEQFSKFADTGKKTFSSFVNKVKAKIAQIDGPSGQNDPNLTPEQQAHAPWNQNIPSQSGGPPAPQEWSTQPNANSNTPNRRSTGGYDIPPPRPIPYPQPESNSTSTTAPIPIPQPTITSTLNVPSASPGRSTSPPAAMGVDRSKLGLLPKRPVSMTSPRPSMEAHPPPAAAPPRRSIDEEDDDLYAVPSSNGARTQ